MYCEWPLTLYFDGACPLCAREVAFLRRRCTAAKLILVDIDSDEFDPTPLGLTIEELRSCLHARFANGQWVTGLDATCGPGVLPVWVLGSTLGVAPVASSAFGSLQIVLSLEAKSGLVTPSRWRATLQR